MFKGVYEHQLDDKNRLRIPSRFKKELTGEHGEKTYSFFRGLNNSICVMSDDDLDDLISSLAEEGVAETSIGSRLFFGSIYSAEEDPQGRVVLPSVLKKMAGITKNVVTIGVGNRLEIWSEENYMKYIEGVDYDTQFKQLGI